MQQKEENRGLKLCRIKADVKKRQKIGDKCKKFYLEKELSVNL
jgi:hypothetical protein